MAFASAVSNRSDLVEFLAKLLPPAGPGNAAPPVWFTQFLLRPEFKPRPEALDELLVTLRSDEECWDSLWTSSGDLATVLEKLPAAPGRFAEQLANRLCRQIGPEDLVAGPSQSSRLKALTTARKPLASRASQVAGTLDAAYLLANHLSARSLRSQATPEELRAACARFSLVPEELLVFVFDRNVPRPPPEHLAPTVTRAMGQIMANFLGSSDRVLSAWLDLLESLPDGTPRERYQCDFIRTVFPSPSQTVISPAVKARLSPAAMSLLEPAPVLLATSPGGRTPPQYKPAQQGYTSPKPKASRPGKGAVADHPWTGRATFPDKVRALFDGLDHERFLTIPLIGLALAIVAAILFASGWYRESLDHQQDLRRLTEARKELKRMRDRIESLPTLAEPEFQSATSHAATKPANIIDRIDKGEKLVAEALRPGVKRPTGKNDVPGNTHQAVPLTANPPPRPTDPPATLPVDPALPAERDKSVAVLLAEANAFLKGEQWASARKHLERAASLSGKTSHEARSLKFLWAWYDARNLTPVDYPKLLDLTPVHYGGRPYLAAISAGNDATLDLFEPEEAPGPDKLPALRRMPSVSIGFSPSSLTALGDDGSFTVSNELAIKGVDGRGTQIVEMIKDQKYRIIDKQTRFAQTRGVKLGRFAYDLQHRWILIEDTLQDSGTGNDQLVWLDPEAGQQSTWLSPVKTGLLVCPRGVRVAGMAFFPGIQAYIIIYNDGSLTKISYAVGFINKETLLSKSTDFHSIAFDTMSNRGAIANGTRVSVYDFTRGATVLSAFEQEMPVLAVALSGGGNLLATASRDRKLRIIEINTQAILVEYEVRESVFRLAFGPDDRYLVAAAAQIERNGPERADVINPGAKIYLWPLPGLPTGSP